MYRASTLTPPAVISSVLLDSSSNIACYVVKVQPLRFETSEAGCQSMPLPASVVRRLKLANARRSLRQTRAAYKLSRENLGGANKPGAQLCRSACMSALNKARHALRRAIRDTEVLLDRVR